MFAATTTSFRAIIGRNISSRIKPTPSFSSSPSNYHTLSRTTRTPSSRAFRRQQQQPQQLQSKRYASYRYSRFGESPKPGSNQPPNPNQQQYTYSNIRPVYRIQYVWRNYQMIILVTGTAGVTFYVINLEEVPITKRRRFNVISPETEKKIMAGGYEEILQQFRGRILPADHPNTKMVARVVERLLPSAAGLAGDEWVVHVIDEPKERNAFVMPGGKVFVFSGILPIAKDENGLAAVLGHEIAHNVAHHAAERLSRSTFVMLFALLAAAVFDVSGGMSKSVVDLFLSLPNSRAQEAEADHIGLLMMAESCYDPEAAVQMWKRMAEAERGAPPQFLSTHPSSYNRMDTIRGWLPEAREKYEASQCGLTQSYIGDFTKAFGGQKSQGFQQRGGQERIPVQIQQPGGRTRTDDDDFF